MTDSTRSVSEVQKMLRQEQRKRDKAITSQSFYCRKMRKVVSPAFCHDCFNSLPYTERLLDWHENRMECIRVHSSRTKAATNEEDHKPVGGRYASSKGIRRNDYLGDIPFSIEEYLCQGFLEYVLDLDSLAERFEAWWRNLAEATRGRVHASGDLQEMIAWFGQRLAQFQSLVIAIGRNEDSTNNQNLK